MKLLFVGTDTENSGAATHFVALAKAMVAAGHQVETVVARSGSIAQELQVAGIRTSWGAFRNALDLRGYATVLARVRTFSPDWMVGNFGKEYWPLIVCGRLTNTPVALFRHRVQRLKRISEYGVTRVAQRFITVSEYARSMYLGWGVPADRVCISYNSVDTAKFKPDAELRESLRRQWGVGEGACVLGYVGRMYDGKGVIPLMHAVNAAMVVRPHLHMVWVGDGPERLALQQLADADGVSARHHFTGWIKDPAPCYCAFSFLAFPSLAPETFGRVAIEAQACGVPVLGSRLGGIPETMQDGVTGFLIEPNDGVAWREHILAMCDESRCRDMGLVARAYVASRFDNAVVAHGFEELLCPPELVQQRSHRMR